MLREGNTDKLVRSSAPCNAPCSLRWLYEGVGQVVVSVLISVLMLGHKAGTVNGIINSVNRRKEIEEVVEQLEHSKSPSDLPDAVAKHARRLTLRDGDDDIAQVASACVRGANGMVRAGGCVRSSCAVSCLGHDDRFGLRRRRASQPATARRKHSRSHLRSCRDR